MTVSPLRASGEQIGPYVVVRHLASGGMGDVYEARDPSGGEPVALKLLIDPARAPALSARFDREARVAEGLAHPHIVAVRGHGRTPEGAAYLAMELLRGADLATRLREPGVRPAEAVAVAMQVLSALDHAHARRV